ncbi:siderophore-interacting protein [Psychrobacter aquaticus]|uniref:Putative siderophore-interacting protein n=1 Tax=Psychrobacter aquaticus CMS 56 TaxID=1354303 RepID=U4T8W5_9GAMM|nr:siderophore-interacting protein [Psychrobacter aquaticus]ERL55149.1 putative siderophore-interacting protein [Psychrobacter aquaticus CMS 56]
MTHSIPSIKNNSPTQAGSYTSLTFPEIADAMAHINEEHVDELLGFLQVFTPLTSDELVGTNVQLTAVYAEAIALQVQFQDTKKTSTQTREQTFFIPFIAPITQMDELNTQYILLKQKADKKLGKKTIKLTKQRFVVQDSHMVSKNMLRLILTAPHPNAAGDTSNHHRSSSVPINEAGYAYLFDLEHNRSVAKIPNEGANKGADDSIDKSEQPERAHCYYTLRKAWQASNGVQAWVDVFLHGDTSGGNWARALQVGDTVISKREFPEKVEHLREGQALLIADETSLPTVARLLELWDNPQPPLVLCVTQAAADQTYFDVVTLGADIMNTKAANQQDKPFTLLPLVTGQVNAGRALADLIDTTLADYLTTHPLHIDKVWGALEAGTAKALRGLLQQRLGLARADSVIKVYWRKD